MRGFASLQRLLGEAGGGGTGVELGAEPALTTPESFADFIRRDNAKWAKLIKEKGIVVEGAK